MEATKVYHNAIRNMPDAKHIVALITGANAGLGFHAAAALARKGAHVILACRSMTKARDAKKRIEETFAALNDDTCAAPRIDVQNLDLTSFDSVRRCAASLRERLPRLDLLINNAGVMGVHKALTEDGFDIQMQVNHLSHFLLTHELLPLLAESSAARVVQHSSNAHWLGGPRFDLSRPDDGLFSGLIGGLFARLAPETTGQWSRYGVSKLCNALFCVELQRQLERAGLAHRIMSVAAHPGFAMSQLFQVAAAANPLMAATFGASVRIPMLLGVAQSAADGCTPLLRAATGGDVRGGEYLGPRYSAFGDPVKENFRGFAHDVDMARALWRFSELATGCQMCTALERLGGSGAS